MALNVQKGIALAVVVLALATLNIPGIGVVSSLMLAMMLYSLILATLLSPVASFFVDSSGEKTEKSKMKSP